VQNVHKKDKYLGGDFVIYTVGGGGYSPQAQELEGCVQTGPGGVC
jgi:hypothetical protein